MPRLLAALLFTALLLAAPAQAQLYLGLDVQGGLPQDEFEDRLDDVGFGVSGTVLYGFGPVAVGAEGGILTYGRQGRPLPARIDDGSAFLGEVETANRIAHLHGVLRLQLPEGEVRPYLDGLFGFNRFYTQTHFEQHVVLVDGGDFIDLADDGVDRSEVTTSTALDDYALSYGVGGGVLIRLAAGDDEGVPFEAFLDLGVRYLLGEEARYLHEAPELDGDRPYVGVSRSDTDLLRPQIGLVLQIGR